MKKLISFSRGRSSAMMLKILSDNNQIDNNTYVCFCNTGKEHEETLKFVNACAVNWEINIHWLEYTKEKPKFKEVSFDTAARNGEPFSELIQSKGGKYLPNLMQRFCTVEMKIKTIERFMKKNNAKEYVTYLGIRHDEQKRINRLSEDENRIFPLNDLKINKNHVNEFWKNQNFDLNLPIGWGNCELCFMKGKSYAGQLVELIRQNPKAADWWIEQESTTNATFINGIKYEDLKKIAMSQKTFDFNEDQIGIDCFCGG